VALVAALHQELLGDDKGALQWEGWKQAKFTALWSPLQRVISPSTGVAYIIPNAWGMSPSAGF
jgi:hypothetical protein